MIVFQEALSDIVVEHEKLLEYLVQLEPGYRLSHRCTCRRSATFLSSAEICHGRLNLNDCGGTNPWLNLGKPDSVLTDSQTKGINKHCAKPPLYRYETCCNLSP
jgi:hypothetical protein